MPTVVLARDNDKVSWELVSNTIDDLEASMSGHPDDPDTYVTGIVGESLFRKVVPTLDGQQARLEFQLTWTAEDHSLQQRRINKYNPFNPDFEVMGALLVGPAETVYFVDYPGEQPDEYYTWQGLFNEDQEAFIDEALDDAGHRLYTETI